MLNETRSFVRALLQYSALSSSLKEASVLSLTPSQAQLLRYLSPEPGMIGEQGVEASIEQLGIHGLSKDSHPACRETSASTLPEMGSPSQKSLIKQFYS